MNTLSKLLGAVLAGVVGFLVVLVGLTAALDPYIWPAVFVSGPVAIVAGILVAGLAFGGLQYREERTEFGAATPRTRARLLGFVVGIVAFALTATAAVLLAGSVLAVSMLFALLFVGLPVGLLAGVVAGLLTAQRGSGNDGPSRPAA